MDFSILLLKKTITLAVMIGMGFISVKTGHVKSEHSSVLSKLCFDWVIPCSVFSSFLIEYNDEIARDFRFSLAVTAVTVVSLIQITLVLKRPLRLDPSAQGSLMFANSAGMALPLASALMGAEGVLFCAPHMGVQNLLIFSYLPMVMNEKVEFDLKKILLNRNILAILAGFAVFTFRIPLPEILIDSINVVGGTMAPFSMMMIGMLLGGVDLRELFANRSIYLTTFLRLLGYPMLLILVIAVTGITTRLPFTRKIFLVLLMCEASPAATLVTQMAEAVRGQEEARRAGSINVVTTLLCVITLPLMVFVYQLMC